MTTSLCLPRELERTCGCPGHLPPLPLRKHANFPNGITASPDPPAQAIRERKLWGLPLPYPQLMRRQLGGSALAMRQPCFPPSSFAIGSAAFVLARVGASEKVSCVVPLSSAIALAVIFTEHTGHVMSYPRSEAFMALQCPQDQCPNS